MDRLLRCIPPTEGGIRNEHMTAIHGRVQGGGGAGGAARGQDDPGDRHVAQVPSEPGESVEAAGGGGDEGGLLEGGRAESWGTRGGGPGPAREDRRVGCSRSWSTGLHFRDTQLKPLLECQPPAFQEGVYDRDADPACCRNLAGC